MELTKQSRMEHVKVLLGDPSVHIEPRKGKAVQAVEYCKKEGKFYEYGQLCKQGHRTDLDTLD